MAIIFERNNVMYADYLESIRFPSICARQKLAT
jgi:hypothetical protein